jgi:hypothetical protein
MVIQIAEVNSISTTRAKGTFIKYSGICEILICGDKFPEFLVLINILPNNLSDLSVSRENIADFLAPRIYIVSSQG